MKKPSAVPELVLQALAGASVPFRIETCSSDSGLTLFNPNVTLSFEVGGLPVSLRVSFRITIYEGQPLVQGNYTLKQDEYRVCSGDINGREVVEWITALDHHVAFSRNRSRVDSFDRLEKALAPFKKEARRAKR